MKIIILLSMLMTGTSFASELCKTLTQKISATTTHTHFSTEVVTENVCIDVESSSDNKSSVIVNRMLFDGAAIPQVGVQSTFDRICQTFGFQSSKLTLGSEEYSVISRSVPFWFQSKKRLFLGMFDSEDGYKVVEKLECLK